MPVRLLQPSSAWPPALSTPDETEDDRVIRETKEKEAKFVSEAIDMALKAEKEERKKRAQAINPKVLLLGQAESGKSTILKNFQIHFAPKAFKDELRHWCPAIHLNLVRSMNFVISTIEDHYTTGVDYSQPEETSSDIAPDIARLLKRLMVLRPVERALAESMSNVVPHAESDGNSSPTRRSYYDPDRPSEFTIRPGAMKRGSKIHKRTSTDHVRLREYEIQRRVIQACAQDMEELWARGEVKQILKEKEIFLHHQSGFFLDDIRRITADNYVPTEDDVLRVRVRTTGAEEYRIVMEAGSKSGDEWTIYDVGGNHTLRAAWAPFFTDVNAVIFLVPACSFCQWDNEDRSMNRLKDNIELWRSLCRNPLLENVHFILFLNKMDILEQQLSSGIMFSHFVPAYKDRPNDSNNVSKYLFELFKKLHDEESSEIAKYKRKVYLHRTIGIDRLRTAVVLKKVRETLLIRKLQDVSLMT